MHRRVVGKLGNDEGRQQPRPTQPTSNWSHLRRPGGLEALCDWRRVGVALLAGIGLLHRAPHEDARRLHVQLFGGLTADADARFTTAGAELLRLGQIVDDLTALEMLGQRAAAVLVALARRFVVAALGARLAF